jgi:hypothetical protein
MAFHRFVVQVEVTLAAPGAGNEPATPGDQELINSLSNAMVGKVKTKKSDKDYTVEKVKKI